MELTFTVSGRSLFLEARICDVISCTKMKFENSNKTSSSLLYALYFYKVLQFQVTYIWRRNAKLALKWNILKRGFVASSVATSQKRNLRIQIWQVLQFHMHCISAKYHSFRLHTFEGETFGSFHLIQGWRKTCSTQDCWYANVNSIQSIVSGILHKAKLP